MKAETREFRKIMRTLRRYHHLQSDQVDKKKVQARAHSIVEIRKHRGCYPVGDDPVCFILGLPDCHGCNAYNWWQCTCRKDEYRGNVTAGEVIHRPQRLKNIRGTK